MLFRRLSVFAGGFTLDAAEAVCGQGELKRNEILDVLGRLTDKSLVIVEQESEQAATRYRLLETIRQYALEKLMGTEEVRAIRDQHLEFYLDLAEKSEPYIFSSESAIWVRRLGKELDNIRTSMDWSTNSGKATSALQMAGALFYFWFAHLASSEWHEWVQKALAHPESRERTLSRAKALNAMGFMYFADVVSIDIRLELEEALGIAREFGDPLNTAMALSNLGLMKNVHGNYLEAQEYLEQGLRIWREMGVPGKFGLAWTQVYLGDVALNRGEVELARTLYEEVAENLRELGDLNFLAYVVRRLGHLCWREGEYQRANDLCKESLILNQRVRSPRGVIGCLAGFAAIAVAQDKYEYAAQLMAAVKSLMVSMGITYMDQQEYERNLARLRAKMDEKTFAKLWAKGKDMSLDAAIALALEGI
jgi:non-specific serine/threonine protein kinase